MKQLQKKTELKGKNLIADPDLREAFNTAQHLERVLE